MPPATQALNPPMPVAVNAMPVPAPAGESPSAPAPVASPETAAGAAAKASPAAETETADTAKVAKASMEARSKDTAVPSVPPGSSGVAEKTNGILLRYNADNREWDRLSEVTNLNRSDRLLCLTPFRDSITMAKMRITMVSETEIRILSASTDPVPSLELVQGRLMIRQPGSSSLKLVFSNRSVSLEMTPDSTVAIERIEPRTFGQPITRTQPTAICCIQGEVTLSIDNKKEELKASNVAVIDSGQVRIATPDRLPPWSTQAEPTPYEQQVGDQFLKLFHPGRPILAELVAAIEDERSEIKDLAIRAIKARGDLSLLMPMLSARERSGRTPPDDRRHSLLHVPRPRRRQPRPCPARRGIRRERGGHRPAHAGRLLTRGGGQGRHLSTPRRPAVPGPAVGRHPRTGPRYAETAHRARRHGLRSRSSHGKGTRRLERPPHRNELRPMPPRPARGQ